MSGVRLLVGTRKGAFVLTSDGTRDDWNVEGPLFAGWEMYHLNGSPADPDRLYASQSTRVARPGRPALGRRREDVGDRRQRVRLRRRARHASVVRRHAAPVGVRARLAPRAVADGPGHGVRRRRGRGALPAPPTAARPGRSCRGSATTRPGPSGSRARAGCACTRSSSDPDDPQRMFVAISAAGAFRTDDGGETWQPINRGLALGELPDEDARGRALRPPDRDEPVAAGRAVHAEALGRDAKRRRRRFVARGERQPSDRLRLPDRRAPARAGHGLRRADQERLRARPAGRQAARLPQPDAAGTSGRRSRTACRRSTAT